MYSEVTTAPSVEPVSTAQAKKQLNITHTDDDSYIGELITAAREWVEDYTNRSLVPQTVKAYPAKWDGRAIDLPRGPLISVDSVQYYDANGSLQTLATSVYHAHTKRMPGQLVLKDGQVWPSLEANRPDPIIITMQCGQASSASPEDGAGVDKVFVHAIKMLVATWYENRESVVVGTIANDMPAIARVADLLRPQRMARL